MARPVRNRWVLTGCLLACVGPLRAAELTVMSFNVEWGGDQVSFEQTVAAIRRSGSDVVGLQEPEGHIGWLAAALGWHADPRAYVISRYPLLDPPGADGRYVLVEIEPGQAVALASVHLPSDPYGPDAVARGAGPDEVLALERQVRLPALRPILASVAGLTAAGMPVFLVGDFNAPAHTDWTAATIGLQTHMRYPLDWPTSRAMQVAGFHDAWRTLYPDPGSHPGLTWWAGRPYLERWTPAASDPQDRIDFIWFAGQVSVRGVRLAGEPGGPEVSIELDPWPSDHRAVVGSFEFEPAPLPELLTTDRRVYAAGDPVQIRYIGPGPAWVRVHRPAQGAEDWRVLDERRVEGPVRYAPSAGPLAPGHYRVTAERGAAHFEREFWIKDPSQPATISLARTSWVEGEAIELDWRNGPGHRNDYVAIYPVGRAQAEDDAGVAWAYVGAVPQGRLRLDGSTAGWGWPLPPGRYVVRLLEDDGYRVLAESKAFEVTAR